MGDGRDGRDLEGKKDLKKLGIKRQGNLPIREGGGGEKETKSAG